jgi:DnaJ-domain-containing protein 1
MGEEELKSKIAQLESINDQLQTEIENVDSLLRLLGFANGLETAKETAKDLLFEMQSDEHPLEECD